jgi:hypothetical protein
MMASQINHWAANLIYRPECEKLELAAGKVFGSLRCVYSTMALTSPSASGSAAVTLGCPPFSP